MNNQSSEPLSYDGPPFPNRPRGNMRRIREKTEKEEGHDLLSAREGIEDMSQRERVSI